MSVTYYQDRVDPNTGARYRLLIHPSGQEEECEFVQLPRPAERYTFTIDMDTLPEEVQEMLWHLARCDCEGLNQ